MSVEILVNVTLRESRVAVVEQGVTQELDVERASHRGRTRDSLEHRLCRPCPNCDSRGFVKTAETVAYQIFREVLRQARQFDFQELVLLAHQDVIELLLDEESAAVADLELTTGKPIRLQAEARYAEEQFDVVPV